MARWLRYLVGSSKFALRQNGAAQTIYLLPKQLSDAKGLTHAGKPSGIGLGWLRLGRPEDPSMILEKTGSGGGFKTYVAVTPAEHTAIFFALTEGEGKWHTDPFTAANNILLGLSNLPPIPEEKHVYRARKTAKHIARVN
jgi:D-alanyl-D-alanine-carboxypeptidase/D-alanyl-D-alanine-endopeptidase